MVAPQAICLLWFNRMSIAVSTSFAISLTARSCPPLGVTAPRWISTEVNVPLSRDVGSAVSYACLGEYMWEGPEGGDRTRAGTLVCERPSETEPPRWNGTLTLPCSSERQGLGQMDRETQTESCWIFSR